MTLRGLSSRLKLLEYKIGPPVPEAASIPTMTFDGPSDEEYEFALDRIEYRSRVRAYRVLGPEKYALFRFVGDRFEAKHPSQEAEDPDRQFTRADVPYLWAQLYWSDISNIVKFSDYPYKGVNNSPEQMAADFDTVEAYLQARGFSLVEYLGDYNERFYKHLITHAPGEDWTPLYDDDLEWEWAYP